MYARCQESSNLAENYKVSSKVLLLCSTCISPNNSSTNLTSFQMLFNLKYFCKFLYCRIITNRYFRIPGSSNIEHVVEFGYSFDVHLNAFFPLLIILHIVQLIGLFCELCIFLMHYGN